MPPFRESPFLRPRELDLLHTCDQGKAQRILPGTLFHDLGADPHLGKAHQKAEDHIGGNDQECRLYQLRRVVEYLPDIKQGKQRAQSHGNHIAQQQAAELFHRVVPAGKLTGRMLPEETCRKIQDPHHHGGFQGHRRFGADPAHHQLPGGADELCGQDHGDHEHCRSHQKRNISALQHKTGEGPGDVCHQQAEDRHRQREKAKQHKISGVQAFLQVECQIPEPQLSLGQRGIKADRILLKQAGRLPVRDPFFAPCGVNIPVAVDRLRQQRHRRPVLFAEGQHRPHGVPVPVLFQFHAAPHHSVGPHGIFQLFLQLCDVLRDLGDSDVIIFQDLIDRGFCRDPFVIQFPGLPSSQHRSSDMEQGLFQDLLVGKLALDDLFVKQSHTLLPFSCWRSASRTRRPSP